MKWRMLSWRMQFKKEKKMTNREFDIYAERFSTAIEKIGHARLLALPSSEKQELKGTTDLIRKVLILEKIAERLGN